MSDIRAHRNYPKSTEKRSYTHTHVRRMNTGKPAGGCSQGRRPRTRAGTSGQGTSYPGLLRRLLSSPLRNRIISR